MSTRFVSKTRGEMLRYNRQFPASHTDINGNTVVTPANTTRLDYDEDGNLLGVKFGDGDSGVVPSSFNAYWRDGEGLGATWVVLGQAPNNEVLARLGINEVIGVQCHKLYTISLTQAQVDVLPNAIDLFPNQPIDPNNTSHILIVKYYNEQIDFTLYEEYNAMEELNMFLHASWN